VLLILEQTPEVPRPLFRGMMMAPGGASEAVPVAAGEQEFHAGITVTYAIGKEPPVTAGK